MKEMIKKYRGSLICSVLVMLIGVLVGFTSTQSMWANVFDAEVLIILFIRVGAKETHIFFLPEDKFLTDKIRDIQTAAV